MGDSNKTKCRRENGTGTFRLRKDGRWEGKFQNGLKSDGTPDMKYAYGKTLAEAKRNLKKIQQDLKKNDFVEIQKTTVKDYMDRWLEIKKGNLKRSSYDRKETTFKYQVYPYIGDIQLSILTPSDIEDMLLGLVEENLSYSTIKKAYESVNACLKAAVIKRDILYNPALGVEIPNPSKGETHETIKFFTEEEIKIISNEAVRKYNNGGSVYRQGSAIILLINTGMRIGELLALEWSDIDFNNKTISIRKNAITVKKSAKNRV